MSGPWLRGSLLVLLTTTIYAKSVPGEFLWDDDDHIHANAAVQAPGGLRAIWLAPGSSLNYFPLTTTAFWAQVRLWGNWAPGFRAVNLVIHVVNSILVWRMLERISVRGAYLTGLVFAVHPVQVQTVAWITELKNLLGFLLYLLAMAAWWRFDPPAEPRGVAGVPTTQRAGEGWHRWGRYGLALVLFVGATLAKANMVVWIGGVALVRYLKQGPLQRRDFMLLGPFLVAGLGVAAFSVFFERAINRSVGADWSATPLERILIAGHALWHYAGTLLWPARLAFFYPRWRPDIHNVLDYLPAAAAVATPVACWRLVPTFGRGPLVGVLWFGGTILPALGLVNIYGHRYSQVYDYMQYPADLGLIALGVGAACTLADRMRAPAAGRCAAAVGLVFVLALATYSRAGVFVNVETLWRDTIAVNPLAWSAHNNLASVLLGRRELADALHHATIACDLAPLAPEPRFSRAAVHEAAGHLDAAVVDYRQAVMMDPDRRDYRRDLAVALGLAGRDAEAIRELATALGRREGDVATQTDLARAIIASGACARGVALLRAAAAGVDTADPLAWQVFYLLAWELATSPDDAVRDGAEAITVARQGLALTGGRSPQLLESLAAGHAAKGDFHAARTIADEAVAMARQAGLGRFAAQVEERAAGYSRGISWRRTAAPSPPPGGSSGDRVPWHHSPSP